MTSLSAVALNCTLKRGTETSSPEVLLNEVIAALRSRATYWVGEAMQGVDDKDKDPKPEKTQATTTTAALNAVHLARLLSDAGYPAS